MTQTQLPGRPVYLVDGTRTPFLKARGKPGPFRASDLAQAAGSILLAHQPFPPEALDEVILGCVSPGPDEANIARVVALRIGCGHKVSAWTVQRNCASGMQALDAAAQGIASGRSNLVLAGGTESMSHHPLLLNQSMVNWLADFNKSRSLLQKLKQLSKLRLAYFKPVIGLLRGLTDPIVGLSMGQTAENLATRFGIDRTAMDSFALRSHQRLGAATGEGHLNAAEVTPIYDEKGSVYAVDDGLRRDTSLEKLAALRPVFDRKYGNVTAGNSAQVTDGAALLLLASQEAVDQYQLPVLAQLVDTQWAGLDPAQMGLGPVYAAQPLLARNELAPSDIDAWEINEAFAAQVLACQAAWTDTDFCKHEFGLETPLEPIPDDRLNIDGGAVSIGHPVGASGARIVLHLAQILKRRNQQLGVAAICIGGGQGGAVLIRRSDNSGAGS